MNTDTESQLISFGNKLTELLKHGDVNNKTVRVSKKKIVELYEELCLIIEGIKYPTGKATPEESLFCVFTDAQMFHLEALIDDGLNPKVEIQDSQLQMYQEAIKYMKKQFTEIKKILSK